LWVVGAVSEMLVRNCEMSRGHRQGFVVLVRINLYSSNSFALEGRRLHIVCDVRCPRAVFRLEPYVVKKLHKGSQEASVCSTVATDL
jgi:hypothetical protein